MKEIILPPHLYDRIKASAGEHGGVGAGKLFSNLTTGTPHCVHGHAWGTCTRYAAANPNVWDRMVVSEPSLAPFLSYSENDARLAGEMQFGDRIPFARWCELLNVKRGVEVTAPERELVSVA